MTGAQSRTRVLSYSMMSAGGATAFAIPVASIQQSAGWLVYLWATFLLIGGGLATYGAVTDRWIGELLGLPLISSAFAVYFVVLGLTLTVKGGSAAFAFGAIALILIARWQDVNQVRLEADREVHRNGGQ